MVRFIVKSTGTKTVASDELYVERRVNTPTQPQHSLQLQMQQAGNADPQPGCNPKKGITI